MHVGGLVGYLGRNKTIEAIHVRFFWLDLKQDVAKLIGQCCQLAKYPKHNMGLYMLLSVPSCPWQDVGMDFMSGLPLTIKKNDSIYVVVDQFSKMAHFTPCFIIVDASKTFGLFSDEVVRLYGSPKTIVSNYGVRFQSNFWRMFGHSLKQN